MSLSEIRSDFFRCALESRDFEISFLSVLTKINAFVKDAYNWQLIFDLLHFDWAGFESCTFEEVSTERLDQLSLRWSPYGKQTETVIQQQKESAEKWAQELEACEISPMQALGIARQEMVFIAEEENRSVAIADSPSPISIPIELVRLYRVFYRAEKRYKPDTTNALKPMLLAKEVIRASSSTGLDLELEVTGRLVAFMRQVRASTAKGRWVLPNASDEHHAIAQFSKFIVQQVLGGKFNGDKATFSSKRGIGLIEDACFYLYVLEAEKE